LKKPRSVFSPRLRGWSASFNFYGEVCIDCCNQADETSEVLKIPNQYHASLIGQSGRYAIRLEETYGVKITFPRQGESAEGRTREPLKPDEVLVKGGRKGVASAKSELLDVSYWP
jgi:hypothetical protein